MNADELLDLARTFDGIADGKPWQLMPKAGGLWRDPIDTTPVQAIERNYKIRLKPWELTDTVNGHTLPDGASWHRSDFTEDMLPAPYRPIMFGEDRGGDDEVFGLFNKGPWRNSQFNDSEVGPQHNLSRTTRPIPFVLTLEQIADGWLPWSGGECPVEPESRPWYILRKDAEITNDATAGRLAWEHLGSVGDIIAYSPDPYGKFRQALAEGKAIQYRGADDGEWADMQNPTFLDNPDEYRIKPEPQWLPIKNQIDAIIELLTNMRLSVASQNE